MVRCIGVLALAALSLAACGTDESLTPSAGGPPAGAGGGGGATGDTCSVDLAAGGSLQPQSALELEAGTGPEERSQAQPALAFGSGLYLAVWTDDVDSDKPRILAARLDSTGSLLDPAPLVVHENGSRPTVATDGKDFLVAWSDGADVFGARLTSQGELLEPTFAIANSAKPERGPAAAWLGSEYLVAFEESDRVLAQRVSTQGTSVGAPTELAASGRLPALTVGASGPAAVWVAGNTGGIRGSRLASDGSPLDPGGIQISASAWGLSDPPALVGLAEGYWVVWGKNDICGEHVHAVRLDGSLAAQGTTQVDDAARPACGSPAAARVGDSLLVGYVQKSGVAVCVLDALGKAASCQDIRSTVSKSAPALASSGAQSLLVYPRVDPFELTGVDLVVTTVAADGELGPERKPLPPGKGFQLWPAVASRSGGNLLVWYDSGGPRADWHVRAAAIDEAGTLGTPAVVGLTAGGELLPAAAVHSDGYLVAWIDDERRVLGRRVGADGTPVGEARVLGSLGEAGHSSSSSGTARLALSAAPGVSLVVWIGDQPALDQGRPVLAARVSSDGELLDPSPIALGECSARTRVSVAAMKEGFVVGFVWQGQVFVTRVDAAGKVLGTEVVGSGWDVALLEDGGGVLVAVVPDSAGGALSLLRLGADGRVCHHGWKLEGSEGADGVRLVRSHGRVLVAWSVATQLGWGGDQSASWLLGIVDGDTVTSTRGVAETAHFDVAGDPVIMAFDSKKPSLGHAYWRSVP